MVHVQIDTEPHQGRPANPGNGHASAKGRRTLIKQSDHCNVDRLRMASLACLQIAMWELIFWPAKGLRLHILVGFACQERWFHPSMISCMDLWLCVHTWTGCRTDACPT